MRILVSIFIVATLLLNSGCAIYQMETTNRGGYLDSVLDKHWLKADSKSMRALRAFAMQVSLARIASVSAKNESDRQLLAIRIGALTKRFTPIYMCAFNNNPLAVPGAETDPCFYYDSAMVDYSTGLFDLAMIALPFEDAKALMATVTGSFVNPINVIDLLNSLVQIGKDALKYGRVVGALYRDTVELEVQVWIGTPGIDNRPPPYRVTPTDIAPLYEIYTRGNDDMPAWIAEMAALRARGLEPFPQQKFFYELAGLMNYICDLITSDKKSNNPDTCKANLPKISVAPVSALGPSLPFRIGDLVTPRMGGASSGGPGSGRGTGEDPTKKMMGGARTAIEKAYTVSDGNKLQVMLCVSPSMSFDDATRAALKKFNQAFMYPDDKNPPDQINLPVQQINIGKARKLFPSCTDAKFRDGYEVGIFANFTDIRDKLKIALEDAKLPAVTPPAAPVMIDTATRKAISGLAATPKFGLNGTDSVTRDFYHKLSLSIQN